MIHDVLLPRTGSTSSDQATIVTWHVAVGAQVAVGDVVAEVETDKSVVDVESTVAGTVVELCAAEEDELTIGDLLLRVDDGEPTTGGAADQPPAPPAGAAAPPTGTDTRPTRAASPRP
ncbi:MAG TPA: biotin/lipoyl-containing protein, partial [Acidimicrobiales bacterium]